ncbi:hypothetical protein N431DRAFT_438753 [Stipitochalara longipes BDJ]|nr:hypothetical protein N431DRAFT_438753 [Stipitochalara longipes BDJ]
MARAAEAELSEANRNNQYSSASDEISYEASMSDESEEFEQGESLEDSNEVSMSGQIEQDLNDAYTFGSSPSASSVSRSSKESFELTE